MKDVLFLILLTGVTVTNNAQQVISGLQTAGLFQVYPVRNGAESIPGIVYFSVNNGTSWENKSVGLPKNIFLSDIAVSDEMLGVSTKQHGIFIYNFEKDKWEETAKKPKTSKDIDAIFFFGKKIFAGSQGNGIFVSFDKGKNWNQSNTGLGNLTIRRFAEIENRIYAGTNGGLYKWNEPEKKWEHIFGDNLLQVNGIIEFDREIYIGTNHGVYKSPVVQNEWKQVYANISLHNISSANGILYAMAYNELFASKDRGQNWYNDQYGIPEGKYSFQLQQNNGVEFVGQWNGIYIKDKNNNWKLTHTGIPANTAITEMNIFRGMLIASCSHWIRN